MSLLFLLAALGGLLALGLPVAAALGLSCMAYLLIMDTTPIVVVAQRAIAGIDSFTLLSIPLFLLAGKLLHLAGLTDRLVDLCSLLVGRLSGGLAVVLVLCCMLFGTLSGSGTADILAIGTVLLPAMKDRGYPPAFSAAFLATAGSLSTIVPPSIVLIVYSAVTHTSVAALYSAAVIPALIGTVALMIGAQFLGSRYEPPKAGPFSGRELALALLRAIPALVAPGIILGGIRFGVVTATEAAAIVVVYALVAGFVLSRAVKWRGVWSALIHTAEASAAILLVIAMASVFGWILTAEQVPQTIVAWLGDLTNNRLVALLVMMGIILVFGTFMESIAIILIFAPVFLPLLSAYRIEPAFFGVLLAINLAIGANTPPVAVALLTAARVAGASVADTTRHLAAPLAILIGLLFVLTLGWNLQN